MIIQKFCLDMGKIQPLAMKKNTIHFSKDVYRKMEIRVLRFDLERPSLEYNFHELYQAFDPGVKNILEGEAEGVLSQKNEGDRVVLSLSWKDKKSLVRRFPFKSIEDSLDNSVYKGFLYDFLSEYFERNLQWGTLTGIKPVKMARKYFEMGLDSPKIEKKFRADYRVSSDRAKLLIDLAEKQKPFMIPEIDCNGKRRVSIYVGIPLCPSKCAYCSFVSTIVDKKGINLNAYFNNLLLEADRVGKLFKILEISVDTLYIGGGTPTVLSAEQLDSLMTVLESSFDLSNLREYTLEAGRPDTITQQKLEVAQKHGVQRVCLNPQSMNPQTMLAVARPWEEGLVEKQVALIKSIGFETLNMDLIIGLGDEGPDDFFDTLKKVISFDPENITIHNLSIKKGSEIKNQNGIVVSKGYGEEFYQTVKNRLHEQTYDPYYLYRLKYTRGNSENIGYSKPGHEGIYNIMMMSECQSTIGIGAGSTGNLYEPTNDCIQKVFTVKDVKTYNDRFEEIVMKKLKMYELFIAKK
ncbi:coproporphyrinogen dehydrogenase HemZ [Acetobacterium tundrae]|uniref:Coproporphyrinogen dehydrogenase HemZ n=2 Tax=Acetobacterium tundrae TaxID=132932 RepID=A0ABR6WH90_9FIRM|nr:coproporphyrinogen dehydrogenase HemZ [Acetobacterium tundrae]